MRVLSTKYGDNYKEIEIQESFLFFKWRRKYRRYHQTILEYKEPNNFYEVCWFTKNKINELLNTF